MGPDDGPMVDPTFPTAHPRIYLGANRQRLSDALTAHTPAANRFASSVDGWIAGADLWAFPPWNAALLGQLTNDAHYCAAAITATDHLVSTAEQAVANGGAPEVARDSYLYIGVEVGGVVLVYDWCFDQLSSAQKTRWIAFADQAVWNVWHHEDAKWGSTTIPWTGWSVDNPSNNYYYSFLRATMLLGLATKGENPHADDWIKMFRETKLADQLVPTFDADLPGGGSREGTGYGQSMRNLFELYEMWEATTGERIARLTPHTRASMLDYIHKTMPTLDRTAPIGDHSRESSSAYFDYDRDYLIKLVKLFPNDPLSARVKAMLAQSSVPRMGQGFMVAADFMYDVPAVVATQLAGLGTTYFSSGTGVVSTRSGWDTHATWLGLIAGPYTESHAHQDQGSVMLFKDRWLSYDSCSESQSGVRQEIGQHSLVRIDRGGAPIQQRDQTNSKVLALHKGTGWMHVGADVTAAYRGDPDITKVQREMVYLAPDVVVIYDRVVTAGNTTQNWGLVSPTQPSVSGANATFGDLHLQRLVPSSASSSVYDFRASDADYHNGFRLDETLPGGDHRYLHVLSIGGGAVTATATGDTGVTLALPGGKTAIVTFEHDTIGASLTLDGVVTALPAVVDTIPE